MEIRVNNVNEALFKAIDGGLSGVLPWEHQTSRNGDTFEFLEPVTTRYEFPQERVVFSPARDANPFFHFFEALWMLAGRNDVKFVGSLLKRVAEYSDDGHIAQGAYGHRWRRAFGVDQVEEIINHLVAQPNSRRAVLTMWSPQNDMVGTQFGTFMRGGWSSKDIPCNTQAYFKIRDGCFRMTVCCRSNDLIWGAYGANVVHYSMLQEYIAAKVGVPLGPYFQMSDSLHVYTGGPGGEVWERLKAAHAAGTLLRDDYARSPKEGVEPRPMECEDPEWDNDLRRFFEAWDSGDEISHAAFRVDWFKTVVVPMWYAHKNRSMDSALHIEASDWRRACVEWLERRQP